MGSLGLDSVGLLSFGVRHGFSVYDFTYDPNFFPIVSALDYGLGAEEFALWFGIIVLIVVEVGLITPPVGMNLFVINSMAKETPLSATFRGVVPFILSDLIRTAILVMFPSITLVLLRMLY